ncbi:MAG: RraA family protein [Alphaproteobacteria bacterium]|nr:MAG: RraA family protein [Alphaproteobacteria bacterium]
MAMDTPQLLQRCRAIGTSTWSDALDQCGIAGVVRGLVQRSGHGRFAGFAVTARERAGALGSFPRAEFGVGQMIAAIEPGDVLMADVGGADISTFGGLAALATQNRGAAAVVIDGGCRDVEEIRATGLWLASRSVTPTTGKTRLKLEALGEPVTIGGIPVKPGDVVAGDDTGIVVIPRGDLARVLDAAERMLKTDAAVEQALHAGKSFAEAAAAANYI